MDELLSKIEDRAVIVSLRDLIAAEAALDASSRAEIRPDVKAAKEAALRRLRFAMWPGSYPLTTGERVRFVGPGARNGHTGTVDKICVLRRSGKRSARVRWDQEGNWANRTSVVAAENLAPTSN